MFSVILRTFSVLLAAASLSACVAGQSIDFKYQPEAGADMVKAATVAVQVDEDRTYVKGASKPPAFIGHYRAGFGNMWEVTTAGDRPFASVMQDDLAADLKAQGYQVVPKEQGAVARMRVAIRDWNFDTYLNGKFWYDLAVDVFGADGKLSVSRTYKESVVIKGNVLTGAKYAFEDEMPKLYAAILRRFAREVAEIQAVLKGK